MATMRNHEQTFNAALGAVLQTQRRGWRDRVATEMSGSIVGGSRAGRADNLVYPDNMQPVVVEAAFANSPDVDGDAVARLGKKESHHQREIMTAVAVAIPESAKNIKGGVDGMKTWLQKGGLLDYAVYSLVKKGDRELPGGAFDVRYPDGKPNSGYIRGTTADLADLIELAATPDTKIKETARRVGEAVLGIAHLMHESLDEKTRQNIADEVGEPPDKHAMRVAACIWLNALILHSKLAKARPSDIIPPRECGSWRATLSAWQNILKIDYASVFRPAMKSLTLMSEHGNLAEDVLTRLRTQVELINDLYLGGVADVSSDMFQALATDRRTTAAFYTRMEAADMLAGLAFNLIPDNEKKLNIADFACGTGALLKAAYRQVRRRAERKKADMCELHKFYMEKHLHGADIQPIAAHLTAAGLAGMHPESDYEHSNIICASVREGNIGSLDLLTEKSVRDLFGESNATGVDDAEHDFAPPDGAFDLCIMNPPYSRPKRGRRIFGVQGISSGERKDSVKSAYNQLSGTFANMKAGMASAFCLLADRKLTPGGILAAVLPLSAAGQGSWRKFRTHIVQKYSDIVIVGMATKVADNETNKPKSFSYDTGMGELLICARKGGNGSGELTFVSLHRPLRDFVDAHEIVRVLKNIKRSGILKIGAHVFGTCVKWNSANGDSWGGVGVVSHELAMIAGRLVAGRLTSPGLVSELKFNIAIKPLKSHVGIGPSHDDIGHPDKENQSGGDRRGAFAIRKRQRSDRVNLSLWGAVNETQIHLICEPTHRGEVVAERSDIIDAILAKPTNKGISEKKLIAERRDLAKRMLELQSSLFLSKNLRMTSQKLTAAMTKKPCMGGNAWAALLSDKTSHAAYCLWFNSTLGLICRWQCGGRQHIGRAQMKLDDIGNMPCLVFSDKTVAAKKAATVANKEFPRLARLTLMACSYAWRDDSRKEIDKVVLRMLGLEKKFSEDEMQGLREEWCCEPSVHGNSKDVLKALHSDKLL